MGRTPIPQLLLAIEGRVDWANETHPFATKQSIEKHRQSRKRKPRDDLDNRLLGLFRGLARRSDE